MTPPLWTPTDRLAFKWCIENDIKIHSEAIQSGYNELWIIVININKTKIISPKKYGPKDLNLKILELYNFYYNKYN